MLCQRPTLLKGAVKKIAPTATKNFFVAVGAIFFTAPFLLLLLFAGTIFCDFNRKNRKIKYPQNFLPTHRAL